MYLTLYVENNEYLKISTQSDQHLATFLLHYKENVDWALRQNWQVIYKGQKNQIIIRPFLTAVFYASRKGGNTFKMLQERNASQGFYIQQTDL